MLPGWHGLAVAFLWLAFPIPRFGRGHAAALQNCTPRVPVGRCSNCTAESRDAALAVCGASELVKVIRRPTSGRMSVQMANIDRAGGRLGNKLTTFFNARALATLGGYSIEDSVLTYEDVKLPVHWPPLSAANNFERVKELEEICRTCPLSLHYHNECPGLYLAADARPYLRWAFGRYARPGPAPDVAVQFRCTDSHKHNMMGLLPFEYYHTALAPHVTNRSRVSVLSDVFQDESPCCSALALTLVEALRKAFHCPVELLYPTTVAGDFAFFMKAKVFVSSASTYGLFAAIAASGQAYLPVSPALFWKRTPCLAHVQWVSTPITQGGCTSGVQSWFIDAGQFPAVAKHLQSLLAGPWFAGQPAAAPQPPQPPAPPPPAPQPPPPQPAPQPAAAQPAATQRSRRRWAFGSLIAGSGGFTPRGSTSRDATRAATPGQ
eukprot:EG_transcript_6791